MQIFAQNVFVFLQKEYFKFVDFFFKFSNINKFRNCFCHEIEYIVIIYYTFLLQINKTADTGT